MKNLKIGGYYLLLENVGITGENIIVPKNCVVQVEDILITDDWPVHITPETQDKYNLDAWEFHPDEFGREIFKDENPEYFL